MDAWFWWFVSAVLLVVLELVFSGFVLLCFGVAAFVTSVLSLLGMGIQLQIISFIVVSLASFVTIRPFFLRHMKPKGGLVETNVAGLIGNEAMVTETIDSAKNAGSVRIRGELWAAMSENGIAIQAGTKVEVARISGNKVVVKLWSKGE